MSENIQSIANGSFVLGNTSATNFIAGNGIKVDSPSEGTIRISNDETVLWSGSSPTNSAVLSEPNSNFERIKIQIGNGGGYTAQYGMWFEINPSSNTVPLIRGKGAANVWISWINLQYNTATNAYYINNAKSFNFGNSTATSWSNPSVSVNADEDTKSIYKVVGINRISVSNE